VDKSLIIVSTFGDMPMFKSKDAENAIKKWFVSAISQREQEFKQNL